MFEPCPIDTGFDTASITAAVNPAPDPAPATVETGFGDSGMTAPVQPVTQTVKVDAGDPEDADDEIDNRVAGLLRNKSFTDWNAISAFMAAVVPWPGSPTDPGYVNLQYSMVNRANPNAKLIVAAGWPFRTVENLIDRASWINSTTQFKDIWYCLSLQSKAKQNPNNPAKPKAVRAAANALAVKAIWVDMTSAPTRRSTPR